ncbi:hypothetical protein NQ314_000185 [Rhamnusium bicolor]|uniref:C2H2-type domain-containing protein n=1 Tax=Rhamnusium bicolor TaxID=1586634 RepID=A0AAV8ZY46_9CUCU|nr:hypothetical protein NQ314_000185 [Rhamnusium bicolor]
MSQSMIIADEEVEYVLNDTDFVLDSSEINHEGLSDIIYSDGTRAILVNNQGHIIQSEGQTVVLQEGEDLSQYYINDENEIIQYVDEDGNTTDEPQVIYVNEEGFPIQDADLSQYQIAETQEDDTFALKSVKLETQVVDLEDLMRQQGEGETAIIGTEANGYQYAILKDGKLHIQTYNGDVFPVSSSEVIQEPETHDQETVEQILDLSKITGRNLLTGQTGDGSRKRKIKNVDGLKRLLNKKLTLGKTTNGKRLVGKVIHVEKKNSSDESTAYLADKFYIDIEESSSLLENERLLDVQESCTESPDDSHNDESEELVQHDEDYLNAMSVDQGCNEITEDMDTGRGTSKCRGNKRKIVIHEKLVSKDCFGHISRTLSGLMNMESVKKKLQHKNIIVKVVEKKYNSATETYSKNVAYSSGYMEVEFVVDVSGTMLENWIFVPDINTKEAIFGKSKDGEEEEHEQKVNNSGSLKLCEICGVKFEDSNALQEHRKLHVDEGKLFRCSVDGCDKFFLTAGRLKRHSSVHYIALRRLECSICLHRCSSESGLKRHLMTHMSMEPFFCETCLKSFTNPGDLNFHRRIHDPHRYYTCEICKRTFSRHSNLQRHIEIHKGSGRLFQCTICGCSYHYMSSLTRHVVQNHIKRPDSEAVGAPIENEIEES